MKKFNGIPRDVIAYALVLAYGKTRQTLKVINFLARDEDTIIYKPSKKVRPPESYARELNARHEFFRDVMELLGSVQTRQSGPGFDGFFRAADAERLDRLTRNRHNRNCRQDLQSSWDQLTEQQRWMVRMVNAFFFESLRRRTTDPVEQRQLNALCNELIDERTKFTAGTVANFAERRRPEEELTRLIDYVERLTWFDEPPMTGSKAAILYGSLAKMLARAAKLLAKQYPGTEND